MPSVEIHTPSSSSNRHQHGDIGEKRRKSTRRLPFTALSTNTPSKVQPTTDKPMKSVLQRTYSAPLPQSPPLVVEKEEKQEEHSCSENQEVKFFRTTSSLDELDDFDDELEEMWTLKRANPVFDEEDEDEGAECLTPSKRAKTYTYFDKVPETRDEEPSERQIVDWNDRLNEGESGFSLRA
eukprot:CAMPEP_0194171426 /NCGR_PEP_ID=MMETSP0154-20130528/6016_1 /TAXON_ID=1049557 /ORGANISM="Thalassiothrix antarctica, Strain L6-D1" /LENGTH=180 /DNA_ID=CAMNT_0038883733 /DNA_START=60 /DNA_END=602 /DNA_ORIENTATION=-